MLTLLHHIHRKQTANKFECSYNGTNCYIVRTSAVRRWSPEATRCRSTTWSLSSPYGGTTRQQPPLLLFSFPILRLRGDEVDADRDQRLVPLQADVIAGDCDRPRVIALCERPVSAPGGGGSVGRDGVGSFCGEGGGGGRCRFKKPLKFFASCSERGVLCELFFVFFSQRPRLNR